MIVKLLPMLLIMKPQLYVNTKLACLGVNMNITPVVTILQSKLLLIPKDS